MTPYTIRNRALRFFKRIQNDQNSRRKLLKLCSIITSVLLVVLFLAFNTEFHSDEQVVPVPQRYEQESKQLQQAQHSKEKNVSLKNLGMIHNAEDRRKYEDGLSKHAFNALLSERIGLVRPIPDTRNELCPNQSSVPEKLKRLSTSVIICFYNEDFHTLMRTVHTVLERTPDELLKEIILVDDYSDNETPAKLAEAKTNTSTLSAVRLLRVPERAGLIRARLYGAQFAKGRVLFFLDSHCEMNIHWLEPLLARIEHDRTTIASPIIDLINPDTFAYSSSPLVKGGFNWGLHFKWDSVPNDQLRKPQDFVRPIVTPTIAGGLFAIERDYFYEIGAYDSGMDVWGGENIEISFRTWMCGGRLEIVPCSRVGHVFRHRRPYGSPEGVDTLAFNSLRVAHVWMDEYIEHFLNSRSDLRSLYYGDVSERVILRKRLNCSSFDWYLRTVYPEMLTPKAAQEKKARESAAKKLDLFNRKAAKIVDKFVIRLADTDLCLESASEVSYKDAQLSLQTCARSSRRQQWKLTQVADLRLGPKICLDTVPGKDRVSLAKCHEMGGTQEWTLSRNETSSQIYNVGSGTCLAAKSPLPLLALKRNDNQLMETTRPALELVMEFCSSTDSEEEDTETDSYTFLNWTFISL